MTLAEIMVQEKKIAGQIDGHCCADWDEMAVSTWTPEYDCCSDFKKTCLGRIINRFVMWRFNLGWWWTVGRHLSKLRQTDWGKKLIADIKKSLDKPPVL